MQPPLGQFHEVVVSLEAIVGLDQDGSRSNNQQCIFQICPGNAINMKLKPIHCIVLKLSSLILQLQFKLTVSSKYLFKDPMELF